ncbi:MAG: IclR family transcriptional regulator [Actinomycetia bacterium]|nr:IclR family transcriptional regulator [Actinomycetes bacterium]
MAAEFKSLHRALRILRAIADRPEPASVTEIAEITGEYKSLVFRATEAFVEAGLLTKDPVTKRYAIGPTAFVLANRYFSRIDVRGVARPELEIIPETLGEVGLYCVLSGAACVCIDKADSRQPVRVSYEVGRVLPPYLGAVGKCLLAYLDDHERRRILAEAEFIPFTEHTPRSPEDVERAVADIRRQGYAFTMQEGSYELWAVAAPVLNYMDRVVASVAAVIPVSRWSEAYQGTVTDRVLDVGHRISRKLGFTGAYPLRLGAPATAGRETGGPTARRVPVGRPERPMGG